MTFDPQEREKLLRALEREYEQLQQSIPYEPGPIADLAIAGRLLTLDSEAVRRIISELVMLKGMQRFLGGVYIVHDGESPIERVLAEWLFSRLTRPAEAVKALDILLERNRAKATTFFVIAGVCPPADISFVDGLRLMPLPNVQSGLKATLFPDGRPCDFIKQHHPVTGPLSCLFVKHSVQNLFLNGKAYEQFAADGNIPFKGYFEAVARLQTVIYCLGLVGYAPVRIASWLELDENTAPKIVMLAPQVGLQRCPYENLHCTFDPVKAKQIIDAYEKCDGTTKKRLKIPLARLNAAKLETWPTNQVSELVTALEALLTPDSGFRAAIQTRGVPLIASSPEQENYYNRVLDKTYQIRNAAVHAGRLAHEISLESAGKLLTYIEIIQEGIKLCGQMIIRIILDGFFPDWSAAQS